MEPEDQEATHDLARPPDQNAKQHPGEKGVSIRNQEPFQAARGRPKLTWMKAVKDQLRNDLDLSWDQAQEKAQDRKLWRSLIHDKYH